LSRTRAAARQHTVATVKPKEPSSSKALDFDFDAWEAAQPNLDDWEGDEAAMLLVLEWVCAARWTRTTDSGHA
jgi:hypothetical protein